MRITALKVTILAACLSAGPALAGAWEDALAAHDAGRYGDALDLLRPLADQGDVDAQNKLAHMYYYGEGVATDYAIAESWSRKAAAQGSAIAYFDIGAHYFNGTGVPEDKRLAFEWQLKAAEGRDPWGARNVALMYLSGVGVERDIAKFLYWQGWR